MRSLRVIAAALTLTGALCGSAAAEPEPGNSFRDCGACPEMVVLPAGAFVMGSPEKEEHRSTYEGPRQRVELGYRLAVGKYEVTYAEWDGCVAAGGCSHRPEIKKRRRGRYPITRVSWHDAQAYVGWLSQKTGHNYRLLSEAEWEYAARGGTMTARIWDREEDDACAFANVADQSAARRGKYRQSGKCDDGFALPAKVGSYRANRFGLYDMFGNVSEWVADCFRRDAYSTHNRYPAALGSLDDDCMRVHRGGSWSFRAKRLRAAQRDWDPPGKRGPSRGFRVARPLK